MNKETIAALDNFTTQVVEFLELLDQGRRANSPTLGPEDLQIYEVRSAFHKLQNALLNELDKN